MTTAIEFPFVGWIRHSSPRWRAVCGGRSYAEAWSALLVVVATVPHASRTVLPLGVLPKKGRR